MSNSVTLILMVVALAVLVWFSRRAPRTQQQAAAQTAQRRAELARTLLAEATENRNKTHSFIALYNDLLKRLAHDNDSSAPAETTGDYIHRHVPLNRGAHDRHQHELSLLGERLAAELIQLYARISPESSYDELAVDAARAEKMRTVEARIDEAEAILAQLEPVIQKLAIIERTATK